jgi:outer membrane protein OmpA-like peptidoglycan-associated protein
MNKSLPALRITGHTDAIGSDAYNLKLSQQRAKAVGDALQSLNVPQAIITEGRGESAPLESNQSAEGRAINRRVCFEFLKAIPQKN